MIARRLADAAMAAYRRTLFQSVTVQLDSPAAFSAFKDALTSNPQLSVEVLRGNPTTRLKTLLAGLCLALVCTNCPALGAISSELDSDGVGASQARRAAFTRPALQSSRRRMAVTSFVSGTQKTASEESERDEI